MQIFYKTAIFLSIICFQITLMARQTHLEFNKIGNREGFNQNTIHSIIQDNQGFLWFATPNGLIRHDGIQFKTYYHIIGDPTSLPVNQISVLHMDSLGYLIIGTQQGLCRYDPDLDIFERIPGIDTPDISFQNSYITSILVDHNNHLWIGTRKGLFHANYPDKISPEKFHPDLEGIDLSREIINDLLEDRHHNIWIASDNGLILIPKDRQEKAHIFRHVPGQAKSISSDQVYSLLQKKNGQLLAGTATGLDMILEKQGANSRDPEGLYSFSGYPDIQSRVNCLRETSAGQVWVGTRTSGIFIIDASGNNINNHRNIVGDMGSLSVNLIRTIFEDHTGMIWIGTGQGGLNTINPHKKQFVKIDLSTGKYNNYEENLINGLLQDANGRIWISTFKNGIHSSRKPCRDIYKEKIELEKIELPVWTDSTAIYRGLFMDVRNWLWICSNRGLHIFDLDNQQFLNLHYLSLFSDIFESGDISCISADINNNIWIGIFDHGIYVIENPINIVLKNNPLIIRNYQADSYDSLAISSNGLRSIYLEKNGRLWISTNYGLNIFQENKQGGAAFKKYFHRETDPGSISADNIFCVYQDSRENVWVGTFGGGLNKVIMDSSGNVSHFKSYLLKDGPTNNAVYGILEDDHYKLWISSDNGISSFSPITEDFKNYNMHDGLPQNNHRQVSYLKNDMGHMFFGGPNGITAFHPDSIKDNPILPKMAFTELRINNRTVNIGEKVNGKPVLSSSLSEMEHLIFNHKNNNFTIGFSALHYAAPFKNSYSYYLEGYDLDWIETGALQNFANYTNLDPGEYTFYVKGANNDGVWNEEPVSIHITIQSAPWDTLWARIIYALLILSAILFIYRYISRLFLLQNKLRMETIEKENIQNLNQAKLRFFTNISHDFRTPLTLILGSTERLIKAELKNNPMKDIFTVIRKNSNLLLKLVNQLMDFRKIEMGHLKIKVIEADIVAFTRNLASHFDGLATQKNIQYIFETTTEPIPAWFDQDIFSKIFLNLLSNAFKFTPDYGMITIHVSTGKKVNETVQDTDTVIFTITDSGKGIPRDKLEKIFDRFYNIEQNAQGTGIGLALVKSYTELHHGSIEVISTPGKGTSFMLSLPLGRAHFADDEISSLKEQTPGDNLPAELSYYIGEENMAGSSPSAKTGALPNINAKPLRSAKLQMPSILVIDDIEDMRNHLIALLSGNFDVHVAEDGVTGLRQAERLLPDLILCDVMMPEPNGFEVCNIIKNNMDTSHIPVILLTALSEMENRIEGFKYGADEYISKPFSSEYLLIRIKNLITGRQKMYDHFSRNTVLKPKDVKITTIDEKFLAELQFLIEKEIENPEFSVEKLSKKIKLSHMQLYRKTKALTGMTPVEFIRNYRLLTAVKIMEADQGLSILEVMYRVGFSSQSYFTKCFKEKFGTIPSSYI